MWDQLNLILHVSWAWLWVYWGIAGEQRAPCSRVRWQHHWIFFSRGSALTSTPLHLTRCLPQLFRFFDLLCEGMPLYEMFDSNGFKLFNLLANALLSSINSSGSWALPYALTTLAPLYIDAILNISFAREFMFCSWIIKNCWILLLSENLYLVHLWMSIGINRSDLRVKHWTTTFIAG